MTWPLLAATAQLADLATWRLATQHGAIEGNPLMGGLADPQLVAVKLAGALLCALIAWRLAPRRVALLPALIGIVGAMTNLLAL